MFPDCVPLLGPAAAAAVVVVVTLSGPGPGPGPAPVWTSDADPSDVSRLSEPTLPLFALPLPVARLRQLWPEAVRRKAPVPAVAAAAGPRSPGPRTTSRAAAVRAGPIRQRHTDRQITHKYRTDNDLKVWT